MNPVTSPSARRWVALGPDDNVRIVVDEGGCPRGTEILQGTESDSSFTLRSDIAKGHKFASRKISVGAPIVKFGHVIGVATSEILPGDHVHVHNTAMPPANLDRPMDEARLHQTQGSWDLLPSTFMGYRRANGHVGIRNYVVVASSVNCSATVVKAVCRHFQGKDLSAYGLDGIVPITHSSGCAQAIGGLGYQVLNRTLAGWIFHPNVVGAVVIGLGCEGTTFQSILETRKSLSLDSTIVLESMNIQDIGGTAETIQEAIRRVEIVLASLPKFKREEYPVAHLNLALNCGGSDAFSSLTANPALGVASDILVSKGGAVALAEIPECHGAEELLLQRSVSEKVKAKLNSTFSWWQDYAKRNRVNLNNNLSPGNIAGGITTIIEKSLGAVAKAGMSPLTEVVDYSEPMTAKGFILMNTPGFDPVSVTGLVAGGSNLVAFTTGRGSVYGCSIAPTLKIATTTSLFNRMRGDMDFDAGRALEDLSIGETGEELYRLLINVANGQKTCSEELGLGWEEFTPWPIAETL